MKKLICTAILYSFAMFFIEVSAAAEVYIDPVNGSLSGDGSSASPWPSVQALLDNQMIETRGWQSLPPDDSTPLILKNEGAPVKGGDILLLASGDYGALSITGYYNTAPITIAAQSDAQPRFSRVLLRASAEWTLRGLLISPSFAEPYEPVTMVDIDSHSWQGPIHHITVEDCQLSSVADIRNWTLSDWNELAASGISAEGSYITVRRNHLKNVNFGISISASRSLIENNIVENFAGDGMRGLGDYTTFAYNTVKNCYDVNDNHDDGFQSWSYGGGGVGTGEVTGIILRGNLIINYEDPNQPFRGTLQGIGCFDGTFVDWIVENNVVYTDHWHGITLLGARNSRVVNNTVLDINDDRPGPPWIEIGDHKDGTEPVNCHVRNNLTTALNNSDKVVEDCNLLIDDPEKLFVDIGQRNFHLRPGSAAINAGCRDLAPEFNKDGRARPLGDAIDSGAYEFAD